MEKETIILDGQELEIITKPDDTEKQDEILINDDLDNTIELGIINYE